MKQLTILAFKYCFWESVLALSLSEWAFILLRAVLAAAGIKLLTVSFKTTRFEIPFLKFFNFFFFKLKL